MSTLEFMRVLFVWALNETFRAFFARWPEHHGRPWRGCAIKTNWESVDYGFKGIVG